MDVEVSEALPSCEYVDADDTDELDVGTVARAFVGSEGGAVCVDMSLTEAREISIRGWSGVVQKKKKRSVQRR